MEQLLNQADALLLTATEEDGPESRPDFEIPQELMHLTSIPDFLQLQENPKKGKGWVSKQSLPAGTVLMVAKPIGWAMDSEEEYNEEDDYDDNMEDDDENLTDPEGVYDSQINELVVLQILQYIQENPAIWFEKVSTLYPRENVVAFPTWNFKNNDNSSKFKAMINEIETIPELQGKSKEIAQRLPLIVRYNVLSIETCPELLSYPGPTGYSALAGVGLYHLPSFFNHDARPNVSRYAVGDVMWFVTNQDIPIGQELCISYLEHDVLCESAVRRNYMLTLDFKEHQDADKEDFSEEDGPNCPVIDSEVQMELMEMIPFDRLEAIDQLLEQAHGNALPEGERIEEDAMDAEGIAWFQCDIQNLRILKAITLESLGQSEKALDLWERCVSFSETCMPPNDESLIVMRVQAALCAWQVQKKERAKEHARVAYHVHNVLFGGGIARFRRRYLKEFCLNLRKTKDSVENILWPNNDHQQ